MFVCCLDHAELAIEEFLNEYEEAPDVYQLSETHFSAWEPPQTCQWCNQPPVLMMV